MFYQTKHYAGIGVNIKLKTRQIMSKIIQSYNE